MFDRIRSWADQLRPRQLCPECDAQVGPDDINVKEGMALCPGCGALVRLSELNLGGQTSDEVLSRPPQGCTVDASGRGVRVRASTHSVGGLVMTTAFALFWNGITGLFLLIAAAGLWFNLIGPVPDWFPAVGVEDGKPIMNDKPMGVGETLFLCAFLTPFVAVGVGMAVAALMCLAGRVEVIIDGADSHVATGVGPLVWRRRFDAGAVERVGYEATRWQSQGQTSRAIELAGSRPVKFGSTLASGRQEWMRVALREVLFKPRAQWRIGGSRA